MDLLETYNKNRKKHLLNEITATGATGTFVGRSGNLIDNLFAGAFHPIFGDLEKLLNQQVDDNIKKRMFTDDNTPTSFLDFVDLELEYEYTPVLNIDKSKFVNTSETEMQVIGDLVDYGKIKEKTEENKKFINPTNDWKYIYNSK
tara:strand:- start:162 stop:596 length:435 start_codon:yes stop_codon:yes gene_type:complete